MKKGFTLIELIAVIVIIGIIALITVPLVLRVVEQSRERARVSSIKNFAEAVRIADKDYEVIHGIRAKNIDDLDIKTNNDKVSCGICLTEDGIALSDCQVEGSNNKYYYLDGNVYLEKDKPDTFDFSKCKIATASQRLLREVILEDNGGTQAISSKTTPNFSSIPNSTNERFRKPRRKSRKQ